MTNHTPDSRADQPPPDTTVDTATAVAPTPPDASPEEAGLSATEREYRAALRAIRALGMDQTGEDKEMQAQAEAQRLAAHLGLDQPPPKTEPLVLPRILAEEPKKAPPAAVEEDDLLGPASTDGRAWYVLNTYSGHENRVKDNLERRIKSMDAGDRIFRVVVPTEEELEIRGGQRRQVQRKLLPGYVLVEMILDDSTWYVVRNTPGVTGFVGTDRPVPLPGEEVRNILRQMRVVEPRVRVGFALRDSIRVTDGPFQDFIGQVDEINLDKGKVRVLISMFGRETPVELDFLQVEKV